MQAALTIGNRANVDTVLAWRMSAMREGNSGTRSSANEVRRRRRPQ